MRPSPTRTATGWTCSHRSGPDVTTPARRRKARAPRGADGVGRRIRRGRPLRCRAARRRVAAPRAGIAGCGAASPGRSRRRRSTGAAACAASSRRHRRPLRRPHRRPGVSVTLLSSGIDHGAVSARGSSDASSPASSVSECDRDGTGRRSASGTRSLRTSPAGTPSSRGSAPGRNRKPTNGSPLRRGD